MENKFKTEWQTMIKTTVPFGFTGRGGFIGRELIRGKEAAWKTLKYNYCQNAVISSRSTELRTVKWVDE